jgi:exodeoxyribonuclease VII small subunit
VAKQTFETHLAALKEAVSTLEKEEIALEKALDAYEKGVGHYKACMDHLTTAKGRLVKINASLEEEPLDGEDRDA